MHVGIVGFASSGKSALFQLLTGAKPDPGAARSGQLAVAEVPDGRLDVLGGMYRPNKLTPVGLELIDTPGLDPRGGPDNRQVLGLMRQADALLVVLGQYLGSDPADELRRLYDELVIADLTLVTTRIERLEGGLKKPRPEREREQQEQEMAVLRQLSAGLEAGNIRPENLPPDQIQLRNYQLFVQKPRFVVVNLAEAALGDPAAVEGVCDPRSRMSFSAKLELELSQLDEEERQEFMAGMGLENLCREPLLHRLMRGTMGQISFFTVSPKEVRGWPLNAGATALEAAARVHSDMAKGFIRAQVISFEDLAQCGSEREAKRQGLYRLEGKDYIVQDGEVILIRFNV